MQPQDVTPPQAQPPSQPDAQSPTLQLWQLAVLGDVYKRQGLMALVQKGYVIMGNVALPAVALPLVFSIYRVWKKDKAEKTAETA